MAPRRPRGRPRKGAPTGKTAQFTARISSSVRKMLEEAVNKSGGTLSQEIEERLQRSFSIDEERAQFLVQLKEADGKFHEPFGGEQNYAACRCIANVMKAVSGVTGRPWTADVWTLDQVRAGVDTLFSIWRPGEPDLKAEKPVSPRGRPIPDNLGEAFAALHVADLDFTDGGSIDPHSRLKAGLGNLSPSGKWEAGPRVTVRKEPDGTMVEIDEDGRVTRRS